METKEVLKKARVVVATIIFAWLLLEVGIRLVGQTSVNTCGLFETDQVNGFRMKASYFQDLSSSEYSTTATTNAHGYRQIEDVGMGSAKRKILFLGDSFTFGLGSQYNEAFPSRVQAILDEMNAGAFAYNGGTIGYGTLHEYNELQAVSKWFRPTQVVVAYFANDVVDNDNFDRYSIYDGCIVFKDEKYKEVKNFFRENFRSYDTVGRLIRSTGGGGSEQKLDTRLTLKTMHLIDDFARGQNASVLFVLIPNPAGVTQLEGADLSGLEVLHLQNLTSSDYYQWDGHLKPQANEKVAKQIAEVLK